MVCTASCQQSNNQQTCKEDMFTIRHNLTIDDLHECGFLNTWEESNESEGHKHPSEPRRLYIKEQIMEWNKQYRYVSYETTIGYRTRCIYMYDWGEDGIYLRSVHTVIENYTPKKLQQFLTKYNATILKEITDTGLIKRETNWSDLRQIVFVQQNGNIFKIYINKELGGKDNPYRTIEINYSYKNPYTLEAIEKNYGTNWRKTSFR